MDPYEIGWYVESADEDVYGPVSRKALRGLLEDHTITPNTLVRHCTQPESKPAVDQPVIMDQLRLDSQGSAVGDRLSEAWPRKNRDRLALAEDSLPCAWHKRPATLVCARCRAPYCDKCRAKPFRKQFFLCRRCQTSVYNRRFVAYFIDVLALVYLPIIVAATANGGLKLGVAGAVLVNVAQLGGLTAFCLRDAVFGGAGPGKRMLGLRVVRNQDGATPLTKGQGFVRWISLAIPFFNLADASVPYRDPLMRRFGDRWAGTRVLDAPPALAKARDKIANRLLKKQIEPAREVGMTMEDLARIA